MKTFRRIIEPIGDPIDVVLERVVQTFRGTRLQVADVEAWIDQGKVSLRVLAPKSFLSVDDLALLRDHDLVDAIEGGTYGHKRLIALAWLYLLKIGKNNACRSGASRCEYAGGWADACVPGESYFVECGTMRDNKIREAMLAGQTLLVVPYPTDVEPRYLGFEFQPVGVIEDEPGGGASQGARGRRDMVTPMTHEEIAVMSDEVMNLSERRTSNRGNKWNFHRQATSSFPTSSARARAASASSGVLVKRSSALGAYFPSANFLGSLRRFASYSSKK
jgi:hypothetical protein